MEKRLRTIKQAGHETGCSPLFFKQLLQEGRLVRFKVGSHRRAFISMAQFESICIATNRDTPPRSTGDKRLCTVERAAWELQGSEKRLMQLIGDGTLTRYQLHRTVFISMTEIESMQIRKARYDRIATTI